MNRSLIVLPDGTELFSGAGRGSSIQSVKLTQSVNSDVELMPGAACASMLDVKILDSTGGFSVAAGDEVTLYKVDDTGRRTQIGIFRLEKPVRTSAHMYSITGYDRISYLDKDLGEWLYNLAGWPYSLFEFAQMVCEACGVTLEETKLLNSNYMINAFSGYGITGRQLIQWVGQAAGRFCRATPTGTLEFAWYQQTDVEIRPTGDTFYFQNGLTISDYAVAPVEKVQVHLTDEDIGAVYPDSTEECNTMAITGNYLLMTTQAADLETAAQNLYELFKDITYTPGSVSVPANVAVQAGDIITVTDAGGRTYTMYVMTRSQSGQRVTLSCTGSARRDNSTAMNEVGYKALSGKVLNLRMDIEGVKVENRDAKDNLAALSLEVQGITAQVAQNTETTKGIQEEMTIVQQTAQSLSVQIQSAIDDGVSKVVTKVKQYTLDDTGLHIAGDKGMENLLDESGMVVSRSGEVMLQANDEGVIATDVKVRNFLIVGTNARFEDYFDGTDSNRTACFYIGG